MGSCCQKSPIHEPQIIIKINDQQKEHQNPSQPKNEENNEQQEVIKDINQQKEVVPDIKVQSEKVQESEEKKITRNECNNQVHQDKRRILFVGKAGVGKTSLFNQINPSNQSVGCELTGIHSGFQEKAISDVVIVVDTPAFDLDDSIEQREKTIEFFQNYIEEHKQTITTFAIVVNFERTDLMKKKVSDVYKYLHKFKEMIAIIIVDWQLSEDRIRDKQHLERQFKLYNECKLCFIEKKQEHMIREISNIVKDTPRTLVDLKDTIFEKNYSRDQSLERKLKNLTNQRG